ncbi:phenol hydroxylase subunit P4 [Mycolicibacterium gadium]|uniref:Phenol hydroxylase subunit P4 n=1 Tax=Mycolicibacterium gadium TaxID=1794 RepID=A0ABT6GZG7_MYCGU|nr:phenol hydroxylase subunit P4 [Mycolicibacterium gadium]MDG5486706.1 phenol hydroxylase subunit P4 [Mycolicibacterium gadium]
MTIKALGPYDFPAADRQENFGPDQLVNVVWRDNIFLVPACFRIPRSMTWSEFTSQIVDPWASVDLDYDSDLVAEWSMDDEAITPRPEQTIGEIGVPHKGVLVFALH